jgi:hypothetical protein
MARVQDVQDQWQHVQYATQQGWWDDWWPVEVQAMRWGGQAQVVFPAMMGLEGLADVVLLAFGLFALLLAVTLQLTFNIIGKALSWVPVVGGAIESGMSAAASWVWGFFGDWAHGALDVVVTMAKWTWAVIRGIPAFSAHFFGVAFNWMTWVEDHVLPVNLAQAIQAARDLANWAVGVAQGLYNRAVGIAQGLFAQALGQMLSLYHAAVGTAESLFNTARAEAQALFGTAVHEIALAEAAAVHEAQVLAGAVEAEAQTLFRGAEQALHQAEMGIEAEFGRVEQTLSDILHVDIPHLAQVLTGEIAAVGSAAAAATAVVARDFADWREECGNDLCGGLHGDAQQALGLLQVLEAGAVFAFLASAVREPVPTAELSVDAAAPLVDSVGGLLVDVVGVAA